MNDMNQTDQILEELRPRMEAARVSHLRKVFACVAAVPLLMEMLVGSDEGYK